MRPFYINFRKASTALGMPEHHTHDGFEIYYLQSGEKNYFIKDNMYRITQGDVVFIDEHELHRTSPTKRQDRERILLHFHQSMLPSHQQLLYAELSPFRAKPPVFSLNIQEQQVVEDILYKMIAEWKEQSRDYLICLEALLLELLIFFSRKNEKRLLSIIQSSPVQHRKVADILGFINRQFAQPLTVSHISETFYISPYYLCRLFRAETGFSLIEYITAVRMKEAKRLLRETEKPIGAIADEVGFESQTHFGRMFKRQRQCSPSQYRNRHRSP